MSAKVRNLRAFLALLQGVKPVHDGQFMALCHGHHDTKPSLSFNGAKDEENTSEGCKYA